MQTVVFPPRIWNPPTISVAGVFPTLERVDMFMIWLEELLLVVLEFESTMSRGVEPEVTEPPIELQPAIQLAEEAEEANAPLYAAASRCFLAKLLLRSKRGSCCWRRCREMGQRLRHGNSYPKEEDRRRRCCCCRLALKTFVKI